MEALGDGNIGMIRVYGMDGAGKTTLVKEIARVALDQKLFNDAVLVTVSKTPNFEKIQQEVADKLGLVLNEKSIFGKALGLRNRLRDENRLLIILNDVCKELNLLDVGIFFESDQKGCKILLTSRFKQVLHNDMRIEKNFVISLLSEDEEWEWCSHIVGDLVNNSDFQEAKSLLLLCGLQEEDGNIEMEYLMRYGMGWDMFKHVYTLDEARDKVYSLVDQLKDRSLLLDGDNYGIVKMHDVIWDVAISIAKENYMYSFRNVVEVEECQRRKTLEGSKAISLPNGYVD
ncbi:probable disease resistance protein At4g27220 [Ziziphus jujuba]|uniref:Probable disease resistance protein At4g27220 n=1 Tax=Ziziphus jujuba TaxID=326968 RepID=A0ABM3I0C4_ZIZJJ|nr:probable disease resistance protein At4g27220 [Ziziphus jujuba]